MYKLWVQKPDGNSRSDIGIEALKKQLFQYILFFLGLALISAAVVFLIVWKNKEAGEKKDLLRYWDAGSYSEAYEKSGDILKRSPLDSFVLTMRGFVSYQLALAQINNAGALVYVDECILSLRRALLKNPDRNGRIRYVLGKAYYVKGSDYADLSIRYLTEAREASYTAEDLSEYLGLAYAAVHNYRKSVEEFSKALKPLDSGASDRLLIAIADSYMGMEDWESARAYLMRCIEQSKDADIIFQSRLKLGKALYQTGDIPGAIAAYTLILEGGIESAEACYELGEIYAVQGETIRARAAYRRAYRADPSYGPALARLNM
ncbi:MAG: tetratricopeptide repeat protein [Treponema sp.]|jgi:tetratricopeptide (TPR) repeat protein|nr:tetratricopeptide repeat protein [Treponema sp.]